MDTYCAKCNEPWDTAEFRPGGALDEDEARRFRAGEGCPSCHFGKGRPTLCPACDGRGLRVNYTSRPAVWAKCQYCEGTGIDQPDNPAWQELHARTMQEIQSPRLF